MWKQDICKKQSCFLLLCVMNNINEQNTLGVAEKLTNQGKAEIVPRGCFWQNMYTYKNVVITHSEQKKNKLNRIK